MIRTVLETPSLGSGTLDLESFKREGTSALLSVFQWITSEFFTALLNRHAEQALDISACWPNGKALDYESRDCRL
jgi:hypothetical protein